MFVVLLIHMQCYSVFGRIYSETELYIEKTKRLAFGYECFFNLQKVNNQTKTLAVVLYHTL